MGRCVAGGGGGELVFVLRRTSKFTNLIRLIIYHLDSLHALQVLGTLQICTCGHVFEDVRQIGGKRFSGLCVQTSKSSIIYLS